MILPVLFQKCTHDWQVTLFCCKNSPYKEPKDFNDFQFYYFPFKPEKNKKMKKKKKKTQIKTYAFFFKIIREYIVVLSGLKCAHMGHGIFLLDTIVFVRRSLSEISVV